MQYAEQCAVGGGEGEIQRTNSPSVQVRRMIPSASADVGTGNEAAVTDERAHQVSQAVHDVHQLDHRPESELSEAEIKERYDYLRQSLKLDKREDLSEDYIQKILDTFLELFDAVSVGDSDFGLTNAATFRIKLKPGTEPCLLYTSPSPRDYAASRMPSSA